MSDCERVILASCRETAQFNATVDGDLKVSPEQQMIGRKHLRNRHYLTSRLSIIEPNSKKCLYVRTVRSVRR